MIRVLALVFLFTLNLSVRAELVSTGVGMVRGQVVTSREVQIQNLLETALNEKNPTGKLKLLGLDSKAFNKATQDALLETVVALEAHNFNVIQISNEEVDEAKKTVLKTLKNNSVWKSLQVSSRELDNGLHRKIQAKKFIQFRAQSSVLPVTDAEALRYFNENRTKYENLPFEKSKEDIKSYLSRTQVDRRLKDWYDVLLSKYQVKNLIAEM
ncbi:MAG: hypothetical protein ACXVA9_00030 [Bdellovibrionales bacterium]